MLLSFRFANHRSFRDEQQLNLTPVYLSGEQAVRVAGIFGANASGKSNCLDALEFTRRFALYSDREVEPGLGISREPFRLAPDTRKTPSHYVVDLLLNGVRHTYGYALDNERVVEEWLYHYPRRRRRRVFERTGDSYRWGEEASRGMVLERIAEVTAPTALFLSTVARFGHAHSARFGHAHPGGPELDPLHDVYRWFRSIRSLHRPGIRHYIKPSWPDDEASQRTVVELLRAADVGIVDVVMVPATMTDESPAPARLADADEPPRVARNIRGWLGDQPPRRLKFAHRGAAGDVLFELTEESTGTQQLLTLAIQAARVLGEGGTMCVDEIGASLHPLLTAKLIGLFRNTSTNPHHSQLIFTSHDAACWAPSTPRRFSRGTRSGSRRRTPTGHPRSTPSPISSPGRRAKIGNADTSTATTARYRTSRPTCSNRRWRRGDR